MAAERKRVTLLGKKIQRLFKAFNTTKDNKVTIDEIYGWILDNDILNKEGGLRYVNSIFRIVNNMDTNENGEITKRELNKYVNENYSYEDNQN